jgi:hypothetical protein
MPIDKEVLIMRNTTVNRLYDVVQVNFFTETVDFIETMLQYDQAVAIMLELQETN